MMPTNMNSKEYNEVNTAFSKGWMAFCQDLSLGQNPYKESDPLHEVWIMGWQDAEEDTGWRGL